MLIHLTPYIHLLILLLGKLPNWTFSIPFWQFSIDSARDSTHNRKNEWNIKGGSNVVKNLARNKMQRYFSNFQNLYLLFVVVVVVQRSAVDVDVVQMYLSISVSKATQKKNMFCLYFQSSAYNGLIRLLRFKSFSSPCRSKKIFTIKFCMKWLQGLTIC